MMWRGHSASFHGPNKHRRTIPFGDTTLRGLRRTIPFGDTALRGYSASPTDPKRRTRPHRPLRGRTFLEQAAFLTGSFGALRLRLSTMVPKGDSTATANGNICATRGFLLRRSGLSLMNRFLGWDRSECGSGGLLFCRNPVDYLEESGSRVPWPE